MIGENKGILQQSFNQLFVRASQTKEAQFTISCSFFQIYNEQIIDLLKPKKQRLQIRQDMKGGVLIEKLHEQNVTYHQKLIQVFQMGIKNRHISETEMNKQSSRSHSVFTISISCKFFQNGQNIVKNSKLHYVDLAGSQRQKTSKTSGQQIKEASNINRSLTNLGMVIKSLTSLKHQSHIPYRNSKLTYILRDSLGGNSKTIIIATVSTDQSSIQQTFSTLNFAKRAKMVKVEAMVNEELFQKKTFFQYQIQRLKKQITVLTKLNEKNEFESQNKISEKQSIIDDCIINNSKQIVQIARLNDNLLEYNELLEVKNLQNQTIREQNEKNSKINMQMNQKIKVVDFLYKQIDSLQEQNEQLKSSYKEIIKQNIRFKGNYFLESNNDELKKQRNDEILSKVEFYEEKFRLMSIQYHKVSNVVKKLISRQLIANKTIRQNEQKIKQMQMERFRENQQEKQKFLKELKEENRQLKLKFDNLSNNQFTNRFESKQSFHGQNKQEKYMKLDTKYDSLRKKLVSVIINFESHQRKQKEISLQQMIDLFQIKINENQQKLQAAVKGILKEQKLNSQNQFILKQNIYLRERIKNIDENHHLDKILDVKPRKMVKKDQ